MTHERRMPEHLAEIAWSDRGPDFTRGKYSREHEWRFDGGITLPASPSPHVVPSPWSIEGAVDPEEALVAAAASCHMLTFLWLASKAGFHAESYRDRAVGTMTKNERGVAWVSHIRVHPDIAWTGDRVPTPEEIAQLHHAAHDQCFIAQSIKSEIVIEPPPIT